MRAKTALTGLLATLVLTLVLGAASVQAHRDLLTKRAVFTSFCLNCPPPAPPPPPIPPPEGQIEGPCGLAVAADGRIYVSDYHHRAVHVYSAFGTYQTSISIGEKPEGPCGLAAGPGGTLYVNLWHESVVRLQPSVQVFDTGDATGVAVDAAGNVYVNARTHVAAYEPSGAPVMDEGEPLKIGLGSLGDGFGVAVFGVRVYVPDAADGTVKVYEPAVDPLDPAFEIDGSGTPNGEFVSLVDGSVAVDPTTGNLLVVDNLKPGFEHPQSTVYEFDSSGAFLSELPSVIPGEKNPLMPVHGGPSGIGVNATTGRLFVTDGNSELSNVYEYGPYEAGSGLGAGAPPGGDPLGGAGGARDAGGPVTASPAAGSPSSAGPQRSGKRSRKRARRGRGRVAVWGAVALRRRVQN